MYTCMNSSTHRLQKWATLPRLSLNSHFILLQKRNIFRLLSPQGKNNGFVILNNIADLT